MRYNKKEMKIRLDYNNMMSTAVADGFTDKDFSSRIGEITNAFEAVKAGRGKNMMGWTDLPYNQTEVIEDILATAKYVRKNFEYFVVLGIGGSALGPIAAFQAICHLHYNDLPKRKRKGPKFYVEDNVDPERMAALLDVIDVEKTMFNVITKSGSTSETMTQYLIINDILTSKLGDKAKDHIIATTSKATGNLIKIAQKEGYKTFYIPDGVGGRFSELCPVGLFPAAVNGIDIKALIGGAKYMDEQCQSANVKKNPALMAGTLQYMAMQKGKNISVMMPYADGLKFIADWYCQLWGESLGKNKNLDGTACNKGQTPVKALGVTDQHSQVQLYAEGPFDKVITFIGVDEYRSEVKIANGCEEFPNVNFLCGHTMNELIQAERKATEYAITKAGKMNHTIMLPQLNEFTLGQLLMFFMLKTAYTGALLGIDTFNQPGVEEGKNATYALLGRPGYDEKRAELANAPQKQNKYII
ncbi:MAG: glucose-6-phosphate isomerase [Eubacteriales bacterium]|nr:glucose-6-phosphate isomerase [Eubacteriales bacterium]